jgi:nucleotide-binding universal stress UspA family protein
MRPFKRILVATDFSTPAELAVEQAMHVARHLGAEMVLAHAYPFTAAQIGFAQTASHGALARQVLRDAMDSAHDQLDAAYKRLSDRGVTMVTTLVDAPAHEGIAKAARDFEVDLVVVGSHGRTGLARLWLGSVAERTLRSAPCSVLIARSERGAGGFGRIVVPTDFSPLSEQAADAALALARKGAAIEILHCWELPPMLGDMGAALVPLVRDLGKDAAARNRQWAEPYRAPDLEISALTLQGPATHTIRNHLEASGAELVVMGSHGRRGLSRLLLGSVAELTARHAPCSVLVVREPTDDETR